MSWDGTNFKAMDQRPFSTESSGAEQPQSTLQDHLLRNAEYWLHKNSGPSVTAHYPAIGTNVLNGSGDNDLVYSSFDRAILFRTPYQLKPGTTQVKLYFLAAISNVYAATPYDVFVNAELLGSEISEVETWVGSGASDYGVYTVTLNFDQPNREEFETDLIVWFRCSPLETANFPESSVRAEHDTWTDGTANPDTFTAAEFDYVSRRSHILRLYDVAGSDETVSFDIVDVLQSFDKVPTGTGYYAAKAICVQGNRFFIETPIMQDYTNYVAIRSIFIEETRDAL